MKNICLVALALVVMGAMAQDVMMLDNGGGKAEATSFAMQASIGQYTLGTSSGGSFRCSIGFFNIIERFEEIEEGKPLPEELGLTLSPNPFNSSMEISFNLDKDDEVEIGIFSVTGQRMAAFSRNLKAGSTKIIFEADDRLTSGIYIVRVKTEDRADTKRAVYVK